MTLPDESLYRACIGQRHQDYYLAYFRRADARGYAPIAWHWPVLFIGLFWLLYRKQYRFALIAFALPYFAAIIATAVNTALPGSGEPLLVVAVGGFGLVWLPLNANAIYYRWVRREIDIARAISPNQPAAQEAHLQARGGTNNQLPLIVVGAVLILTIVAGSITPASP